MSYRKSRIGPWIFPALATTGFLLLLTHESEFPIVFSRYSSDYTVLLLLYALNLALLWRISVLHVSYWHLIGQSSARVVLLFVVLLIPIILAVHFASALSSGHRVILGLLAGLLGQAEVLFLKRQWGDWIAASPKIVFAMIMSLVSLILGLMLNELVLEWIDRREKQAWETQVEPYYPWRFVTADGIPLGKEGGYLELEFRPFVGIGNRPNQSRPYFSINSQGFRGRELASRQSVRRRVVLVGGSTAFGTGLRSDADTMPGRLEKLHSNFEVINAAVIGHLSGQELALLVSQLVDLKPDLVLTLDGFNDFTSAGSVDLPRPYARGDGAFPQIERRLAEAHTVLGAPYATRVGALFTHVLFPELTKRVRLVVTQSKADLTDDLTVEWIRRLTDERIRQVAEVYARNLSKMKRVSGVFGGSFGCVHQPLNRDAVAYGERYDQFLRLASGDLKHEGIVCLDLNMADTGLTREMFLDCWHLTREGTARAARLIASRFMD